MTARGDWGRTVVEWREFRWWIRVPFASPVDAVTAYYVDEAVTQTLDQVEKSGIELFKTSPTVRATDRYLEISCSKFPVATPAQLGSLVAAALVRGSADAEKHRSWVKAEAPKWLASFRSGARGTEDQASV